MSPLKSTWGLLFRLFPCPTRTGLRRVGSPGRDSPVLVTANFHNTVERLIRTLRRSGIDAWVVVADSKGVNVWCAAGADELDTRAVVSALKTSGVADHVGHRRALLPRLAAPGVALHEVRERSGWSPSWGPVYAEDLPEYLAGERDPSQGRARYGWVERVDTGVGSLFPFYALVALPVALLAPGYLLDYLAIGLAAMVGFFLLAPWIPGRTGMTKVLAVDALLAVLLAASLLMDWPQRLAVDLGVAMACVLAWGMELGGTSSTMRSEFDPFLARLGIGAIGNTRFAGTVRTELLNGHRELVLDQERCAGCGQCQAVCPLGVWERGQEGRAVLAHVDRCTACRACLTNCEPSAIEARVVQDTDAG